MFFFYYIFLQPPYWGQFPFINAFACCSSSNHCNGLLSLEWDHWTYIWCLKPYCLITIIKYSSFHPNRIQSAYLWKVNRRLEQCALNFKVNLNVSGELPGRGDDIKSFYRHKTWIPEKNCTHIWLIEKWKEYLHICYARIWAHVLRDQLNISNVILLIYELNSCVIETADFITVSEDEESNKYGINYLICSYLPNPLPDKKFKTIHS